MAASDGRSTRLARAIDKLEAALVDVTEDDRIALISAGPASRVELGFGSEVGRVLETARSLRPGGAATGMPAALRLAESLCDRPGGAVLLLSDGGVAGPDLACPVQMVSSGGAGVNRGITSLAVRRADALGLFEVFVAVSSTAAQLDPVVVDLTIDGVLAEVVVFDVPPRGTAETLVRIPVSDGGMLRASIAGNEDALAVDDVAWAALNIGRVVRGLLIGPAADSYVGVALGLHPRVSMVFATPEQAVNLTGSYDFVVLESPVARVPDAARVVALGVPVPGLDFRLGAAVDDPSVIRWSFESPLFRFVDLTGLHIERARLIEMPSDGVSVVDVEQGPIAALVKNADREVLAFGFRPDASDLVLRIGFANLVANVVEWAEPAGVPTDSRAVMGAPAEVALTGTAALAAGQPVVLAGVYQTGAGDVVTASLLDSAESLLPLSRASDWVLPTRGAGIPWWPLVLLVLVFILGEGLLARVRGR
jgi:hypothetical protein